MFGFKFYMKPNMNEMALIDVGIRFQFVLSSLGAIYLLYCLFHYHFLKSIMEFCVCQVIPSFI